MRTALSTAAAIKYSAEYKTIFAGEHAPIIVYRYPRTIWHRERREFARVFRVCVCTPFSQPLIRGRSARGVRAMLILTPPSPSPTPHRGAVFAPRRNTVVRSVCVFFRTQFSSARCRIGNDYVKKTKPSCGLGTSFSFAVQSQRVRHAILARPRARESACI